MVQLDAFTAKAATNIAILGASGCMESAYVKWNNVDGAKAYKVYVKEASASDSAYVQLDDELIRKYPTYWRADALGLKAGNYVLKIEAVTGSGSVTAVTTTLNVEAYDRSGFTFSDHSPVASQGVGAYNNDGTLKSNASVLYVTEENKNSVQLVIGSTTYTGVANITQAIKDKNNCQPVAIRIIGQVTLSGLSCKDVSSAYAIGVKQASNVTFEGVGDDATLYTAGVAAFTCKSIEIRNLGLMNWGGGKDGDGVSLKASVGVWVHNNDFFYGDAGSDGDQAKGDGSMDLKDDSQYVTISYNHFWDSGKMSLCGMKSESGENWITYHHNWFDHSDSRHPRVRKMTVHIYNNYFDGNAKYGMGVTSGGNLFAEANYFRNCPKPFLISAQGSEKGEVLSGETGGAIKAYNNVFAGTVSALCYANAGAGTAGATTAASSTEYDAYLASSRTETVPSTYKSVSGSFAYSNFDTTKDLGVKESAIDAPQDIPAIVTAKAGRMNGGDFKWTFDNSVDDASYSLNSELKAKLNTYKTTLVSVGGGSTETPVQKYSVTVTGGSASATQATAGTVITITASSLSGKTFKNWTVTSGGVTLSSTTSTTATFTMPAANVVITANYDTNGGSTGGGDDDNPVGPVTGGDYAHDFTKSGLTSSTFTISGNLATGKGSVTYGGLTLTRCLKMESATSIKFTAPSDGKLVLVFGGSTSASGKTVKVNGTKYTCGTDSIATVDVKKGAVEVTKGDSINLFYMSYTADGSGENPQPEADADYSAVNAAIAKIPADLSVYTEESAAAVTAAKEAVVTGKKASEQAAVDAMAKAIEDAIAKLELKPVVPKKNGIYRDAESGNFYYYVDDVIDTSKTGLVYNNEEWWYVESGMVNASYTGFVENGGDNWYVAGGKINTNFTGLGKDTDEKGNVIWRCVFAGKEYPNYTGLIQNAGYFWYVKNGTVDTSYTGFYENEHGKWYVAAGKVDTNFTGLGKEGDKWLCVLAGKYAASYTGLVKNGGEFWYVENGVLNTGFSGIVETGGNKWLVGTGKLNSSYTGTYTDATGTYNLVNGKVVS